VSSCCRQKRRPPCSCTAVSPSNCHRNLWEASRIIAVKLRLKILIIEVVALGSLLLSSLLHPRNCYQPRLHSFTTFVCRIECCGDCLRICGRKGAGPGAPPQHGDVGLVAAGREQVAAAALLDLCAVTVQPAGQTERRLHLGHGVRLPGRVGVETARPRPPRPTLLAGEKLLDDGFELGSEILAVEPALEKNLRGVSHKIAQPVRLAPQSLPFNNQSDL